MDRDRVTKTIQSRIRHGCRRGEDHDAIRDSISATFGDLETVIEEALAKSQAAADAADPPTVLDKAIFAIDGCDAAFKALLDAARAKEFLDEGAAETVYRLQSDLSEARDELYAQRRES